VDPTLGFTAEASSTGRGLVLGDSFTGALSRATGENVASYAINQGTVANSNYAINYVPANFAITAKALTIGTATANNKTYDGTTTATMSALGTLSGFVGSETVTAAANTATFADANVGTGKTITLSYTLSNGSNGGLASNYSLANNTTTGAITAIFIPRSSNVQDTIGAGAIINVTNANNSFQVAPVISSPVSPAPVPVTTTSSTSSASNFSQVNVTQAGRSSSQSPAVISAEVPLSQSSSFSFKLPDQLSQNIISSGSKVTAQSVDGKELPSWLKFDPKTMEFKATSDASGSLTASGFKVAVKVDNETIIVEIKATDVASKP
jgi:hypothetical protein